MEFIKYQDAIGVLEELGLIVNEIDEDHLRLEVGTADDDDPVIHLHLAAAESTSAPLSDARIVPVEKDRLPDAIEHLVGKLHLAQVLLIPVGKWRSIFDAVAFSLAANEDWQEIDAAATVELNTRDPLLCTPGDFHTLNALVRALLTDGETTAQSLMLTTTAAPFVAEIVPDGAVRISVANEAVADEIVEMFGN